MVEKNIEGLILKELSEKELIEDSYNFSSKHQIEHAELVGNLKSLSMDEYVLLSQLEKKQWVLTKEGLEYMNLGTPEYRLYQAIPAEGGILKDQLTVCLRLNLSFF